MDFGKDSGQQARVARVTVLLWAGNQNELTAVTKSGGPLSKWRYVRFRA
jgi:hypothetical protein